MARVKIQVERGKGLTQTVVIDTSATVGATLGSNVFLNGQVATPAAVLAWLGNPGSGGSGAAAGRPLTASDDTNVTLTLGGYPTGALVSAASIAAGWVGQLSAPRGGTGFGSYTAGDLLYASGAAALAKLSIGTTGYTLRASGGAPAWVAPAALTKTDDTNITLTLGGAPTTALLQAASVTAGWTGTLAKTRGGFGLDASTLTGYVKAAGAGAISASSTIPYSDLTGTPTIPVGANPSASFGVNLAGANGSASTFLRSDAVLKLDQTIVPTWTGAHVFTGGTPAGILSVTGVSPGGISGVVASFVTAISAATTNQKLCSVEADTTSMYFQFVADNLATAKRFLRATRNGTAVTAVELGNTTDNPPIFCYGTLRGASTILSVGVQTGSLATPTQLRLDTSFANTVTPTNQQLKVCLLQGSATEAYGWALGSDGSLWHHSGGTSGGGFGSHVFATANVPRMTIAAARVTVSQPFRLQGYTVATLPAGAVGDTAYVTDALAPSFLAILTGGGAITTPCFYNGTNWIAQ